MSDERLSKKKIEKMLEKKFASSGKHPEVFKGRHSLFPSTEKKGKRNRIG